MSYDANDVKSKPSVRQAGTQLIECLRSHDFRVGIETWEGPKGIDDALVGGITTTELWDGQVDEYLKSLEPMEVPEGSEATGLPSLANLPISGEFLENIQIESCPLLLHISVIYYHYKSPLTIPVYPT